ncbi:MAG: Maf family protein [Chthoniobacteraceae bacterium]
MNLVLASASPRRRQLLTEFGYCFRVEPADVDEIMPPDLDVAEITLFNAQQKALHISKKNPSEIVVGVDTLVALDGASLGKPADMEAAFEMISRLNGRIHEVYTAVWAERATPATSRALVEMSRVKFRTLDEAGLRRYLARINPLDKAGAYAAQDDSDESIVETIEGSRTNVIGLPMEALGRMLREFPQA